MLGLFILFATAYGLLILIGTAGILWQMNRPRRKTMGVSMAMGGPGDPADLELCGQEVVFNLSDGSESPGWIIDGDDPNGPVAVILHGHRDSRFGSLYRAKMLRRYVSKSVVFDLPGCGDAEAKRCLMGQREADDTWAVVAGLPPDVLAGRSLVLLGYSMGATIALKAGAMPPPPEAMRKAFAGQPADGEERLPWVGGVIACAPYRVWDEGLRGQMGKRKIPAWPIVPLLGLTIRWWPFGVLAERPGFDRAGDAAELRCPLLVLHGDADRVCPVDAGRRIAEAAADGTLVVIPEGTHNQLLAANYAKVHEALAAFFEKLGKNRETGMMERWPASPGEPS